MRRGSVTCWATVIAGCVFSVGANAQVAAHSDPFGNAMEFLLPAAAVALTLHNDDMEGLRQFGYTALLTMGSTELLKRGTNSKGPDGSEYAFPSGHTAIAFASAAYVNERYGIAPAVPLYALAALTGYSRVHTHHHYTKDVVAGAAVGIASALTMTHPFGPRSTASVSYSRDALAVNYATSW